MVRAARVEDFERLVVMRRALWPDEPNNDHTVELQAFFRGEAKEPLEILVAEGEAGELVGFCELSIRAYAEDCHTDHVGYLEGWWVAPEARQRGVGRELVEAAKEWARRQGCTEFASDAEVGNEVSRAAHRAIGFTEVGLIRCFRLDL